MASICSHLPPVLQMMPNAVVWGSGKPENNRTHIAKVSKTVSSDYHSLDFLNFFNI